MVICITVYGVSPLPAAPPPPPLPLRKIPCKTLHSLAQAESRALNVAIYAV